MICKHEHAEETKVHWCRVCGAMRVWRSDKTPMAFDPWVLPEIVIAARADGGRS